MHILFISFNDERSQTKHLVLIPYLPIISLDKLLNFSSDLLISIRLKFCFAKPMHVSNPIPDVHPVTKAVLVIFDYMFSDLSYDKSEIVEDFFHLKKMLSV